MEDPDSYQKFYKKALSFKKAGCFVAAFILTAFVQTILVN